MKGAFFDYDWAMLRFLKPSRCPVRLTKLIRLWLIVGLNLAGCAQIPPAPSLPPTQWLRVQISPSLVFFNDLYSTCTPSGTGLAVQQVSGAAFDANQVDITLRWGASPDPGGYAAQIGEEELVLVVHPDNPVESLSLSALKTIFSGSLTAWDWDYLGQAPADLSVYAYPPSSDAQGILSSTLLLPQQALPREIVVTPGPAEMRAAVAADPGGLGFLPRRWVDPSVKIVPIAGLPPGSWVQPILALSAVEPKGPAREWLLCVQQGMQ